MRHATRGRTPTLPLLLTAAIALTGVWLGCGAAGDPEPPDFYITVKLHTGFQTQAVHRLEVVVYDPTMVLGESQGQSDDGGLSWETRDGATGDEFAISLTGTYFVQNAVEVSQDTFEIDIPFHGGDTDGGFNIRATVYWTDFEGVEEDIAFGTAILELPVPTPSARVPVEVTCRPDWAWTCMTGCGPAAQPCEDVEDCGSGFFECVEGCCVPQ